MNHHRKYLPHDSFLINQIGSGSLVGCGRLIIDVGHDVKARRRIKPFEHLSMRLKVGIFLGNGNHRRIPFGELIENFLQLNQLLIAERSPMRPVRCYHDVFSAKVFERYGLSVGLGQ